MSTTGSIASCPKMRFSNIKPGYLRPSSVTCAMICAGLFTMAAPLRADRIDIGRASMQRVTIVDLDEARLAYRTPGGELRFAPLPDVDRLFVDSISTLADFNEAERHRAQGRLRQAVTLYERAVRVASSFWERLVRARLIQTCDQADRIDLLVTHFVSLLDDEALGAPLAAAFLPRQAPVSNTRGAERAIRLINERADAMASQSAKVVLDMLRFCIADRTDHHQAAQFATDLITQPVPLAVSTRSVYHVRAAALRRWAMAGSGEAALREINADLLSAPYAVLPELLLLKGQLLRDSAKDDESLIRAGWAAMRIPIHYPQDALAPEAFLLAADICERIGRRPTALQLLDECLAHPKITDSVRDRALAEAARLRRMAQ